jgi:His-Xaa-Ser system protein HxsD
MHTFLETIIKDEKFELLIDTNIFSKDIILKAAYTFLDKWYFYFKQDKDSNIIVQYTTKEWVKESPDFIIGEFSDELLSVILRDQLEKDNKIIRENIVWAAISNSLDVDNFVQETNNEENNQIDFDKDIDDILSEIENDPDLKINEEEIENILKEIEEETEKMEKPTLKLNVDAVKGLKDQFNK